MSYQCKPAVLINPSMGSQRSSDCDNERTGMTESVCALQTAEVISWGHHRH